MSPKAWAQFSWSTGFLERSPSSQHRKHNKLRWSSLIYTWKNIFAVSVTKEHLSCLNFISVPIIWWIKFGPAIKSLLINLLYTRSCNQREHTFFQYCPDGKVHVAKKYQAVPFFDVSSDCLAYPLMIISSTKLL